MKHRVILPVCIATALIVAQSTAQAQTSTQNFNVTATVQATCVVFTNNLSFGTYVPTALKDGSAELAVTCTNTTPYNVRLSAGGSGNIAARTMAGTAPVATLGYNLYRDAGRAQVWGVTDNTDTVSGTGTGGSVNITIYGRIPAGQYVPPQGYTDTITATVSF